MKWIKDEEFIRGKIPLTKFDIRVVTMAVLELEKKDIFLDIGAGTGSISIQAALMGAKVFSIEVKEEGIDIIKKNIEKFGVNINLIKGTAPEEIGNITQLTKCFIGGSGGKLKEIFEFIHNHLESSGIIAANFIIPDNMVQFKNLLKEFNYKEIETRMIQSSFIDNIGLLKAQNPVFIVKGRK